MIPSTDLNKKVPVTKATVVLLFGALLIALIWFGRPVVIPVLFALLIGIVLRPVEAFLNIKMRIPRVISILLTVILFMCVITGIISLATYEFTRFLKDLPTLVLNLEKHFVTIQQWLEDKVKISYLIDAISFDEATRQIGSYHGKIAEKTMRSIYGIFNATLVFPVMLFLMLYYRPLLLNFLLKVYSEKSKRHAVVIIRDIRHVMQRYVGGLFLEMLSVASLQTIAMWIIGIKYFFFIGLLAGILNMIPYLGNIISGCLALMIALATGAELQQIFLMILGFVVVQFIDNNILLPKLVGHSVRINAIFSIGGVITGGLIAGVAGMFLAIPLMAVIKVIFDNSDHYKPWGELMGDSMPKTVKWKNLHWPKID